MSEVGSGAEWPELFKPSGADEWEGPPPLPDIADISLEGLRKLATTDPEVAAACDVYAAYAMRRQEPDQEMTVWPVDDQDIGGQ